jgi:hypothetical protein
MNRHTLAIGLIATAALAACGKVQEKAGEKVAEKAIEAAIAKDGTQAKVNLSEGGMKITTTDAAGKTANAEIGNAQVGEADVGVPFYPGAKAREGTSMRIASGEGSMMAVGLHSDDAPDKVAAFYRDKLKAQSEGKQLVDMSGPEGAVLSLVDEKTKNAIQVHVSKADAGSDILIHANRAAAK